ncbi:MAG: tRNA uracil 4-sulfurtransferase ThiI [Candidatus Hydrothermarchaeota archaeon]
MDAVIIRYDEIGLKGKRTRRKFEELLIKNIIDSMSENGLKGNIDRRWGRIYIWTREPIEVSQRVSRVFGISSASPAYSCNSDLEEIKSFIRKNATSLIKKGESFAIRARRVGKHDYTSQELAREAGSVLVNLGNSVDLDNPDREIFIEVRDKDCFIFTETYTGPGGLPLGSQGKLVSLLSGGIDSPVATWLMMKRGCSILPVYFDNSPFTDETTLKRAIEVAKVLSKWSIGEKMSLRIVPYGEFLEKLTSLPRRKFTCVLCKRSMYRIANIIARENNARGIVTGESLGQVASQTLDNILVLDDASTITVFRPLIGIDKKETERYAKLIGTFEKSIQKAKSCSAVPEHPVTGAKLEDVLNIEKDIDIDGLIEKALKASYLIELD